MPPEQKGCTVGPLSTPLAARAVAEGQRLQGAYRPVTMGDQEAVPDVLMIPDHNATCTVTNTPPFMRGFAPPPTRASGSKRQAIARPADVEKPGYRSAQGGSGEAENNPKDKEQLGISDRLITNQQEYSKADHDQRGQRCRNAVKLRARRANCV